MTPSYVVAARCALMTMPLVLLGCSDPAAPPSGSESSTTQPASSASATPDWDQRAVDEATALVPTYVSTLDALFSDPSRPIDDIFAVAVAPEATAESTSIQSFRSSGYIQTGTSSVVSTRTVTVDLDSSGPDDLPSVEISACIDVSQVDVVDAAGVSVAPADRAPFLVADLTVLNIDYPDPASWRVSSAPNTQAQACPD